MEVNKIYQGSALNVLKKFPEESIDMCITSPPYWALRDYGNKDQIGLEETFEEYVNNLCNIFDEVKRVLKKEGTCWVNIGDTYYGSGKGVGTDPEKMKESYVLPKEWKRPSRDQYDKVGIKKTCLYCGKEIKGQTNRQFCNKECLNKMGNDFRSQKRQIPDKCLSLVPFRFAIEMVNRGWILRNVIIWHKPNCMPSSVKDRFTADFEYLFFFSKNKKYFFEQQFEPYLTHEKRPNGIVREREFGYDSQYPEVRKKMPPIGGKKQTEGNKNPTYSGNMPEWKQGRNKRCVWTITTKPFKEAHFAVYPEELIEIPIKSGCPEFVCSKCGKSKIKTFERKKKTLDVKRNKRDGDGDRAIGGKYQNFMKENPLKEKIRPSCECNGNFIPGIVLDPFSGSGTTGIVAIKQNKRFIGIELNSEYIKIAEKRIKLIKDKKVYK